MQDLALRLCWNSGTGQAVTTDAVSENVISYGADAPMCALKTPVVKIVVPTAFAGMASGMIMEFRVDTAAGLASGSQEVIGRTRTLLIADLTQYSIIQIALSPKKMAASYQYAGLYFDLVSEAASAGNIIAWIGEKGESEW